MSTTHGEGEGQQPDHEPPQCNEVDFEDLLQAHPEYAEGLRALQDGLGHPGASESLVPRQPLKPGVRIGEYELITLLGQGGMGQVWEALQTTMDRKVALKVLHPHVHLSLKSVERFHREAMAGGRLSHQSLVQVHSVGEADGTHFMAQEMVEGSQTLADLLEEARSLNTLPQNYYRRTAELFAATAEALAHAHENGVVHRDVKPSNILITPAGLPKVADFGLAMVEDQLSLSRTGDLMGTPFYMSPEQAASKRMGIDHRTDVFSLGAALYESLTLTRPFNGDTSQQVIHKILLEDPPNPDRIRSKTPRDLSIICQKAMEKQPDHRYAQMSAMALDLRLFLSNDPILATPPSLRSIAIKWIKRNPTKSAVAAVMVIALGTTSFLYTEAMEQRLLASQKAASLQALSKLQGDILANIQPEGMGRSIRSEILSAIRTESDQGIEDSNQSGLAANINNGLPNSINFTDVAQRILEAQILPATITAIPDLQDHPLTQADLHSALYSIQFEWGLYAGALASAEASLELRQGTLGPHDGKTLEAMFCVATALKSLGRFTESEAMARNLLIETTAKFGGEDEQTMTSMALVGDILAGRGDYENGIPFLQEAAEGLRTLLGEDHRETLAVTGSLGTSLGLNGQYEEALAALKSTMAGFRLTQGEDSQDFHTTKSGLALVLWLQGNLSEAETIFRDILSRERRLRGNAHPSTLYAIANLGGLLSDKGDFVEAESLLRESYESRRRTLGLAHQDTLLSMNALAVLCSEIGLTEEAEQLYQECLPLLRLHLGIDDPITWTVAINLAELQWNSGEHNASQRLFNEILGSQRRVLGKFHVETLLTSNSLGHLLQGAGELDQAEDLFREGLQSSRRHLGDDHPTTITFISSLGSLLLKKGDLEESELLLREEMDANRRTQGIDSEEALESAFSLGSLLFEAGRFEEAEALLTETQKMQATLLGEDFGATMKTGEVLRKLRLKRSGVEQTSLGEGGPP